jgi:hypothetical protein
MKPVEEIIKASLKELLNIGSEVKGAGKSTSKLIFPQYRKEEDKDAKHRVSEQEARFLFVRELEKESNEYYYSVEAPTTKKYRFSGQENPKIDPTGGQSGSFDVCLYEKQDGVFERKYFIEFKALNPDKDSISKDFLKLICDEDGLTNYFVHILEKSDSGTWPNIKGKYEDAINNTIIQSSDEKSQMKIFLCDIEKKTITLFGINDNQIKEIEKIEIQ